MDRQELREARQRLGVTQVQLAQALGVTARSVIAWEKGKAPISTVVALAIRHLLVEEAVSGVNRRLDRHDARLDRIERRLELGALEERQ